MADPREQAMTGDTPEAAARKVQESAQELADLADQIMGEGKYDGAIVEPLTVAGYTKIAVALRELAAIAQVASRNIAHESTLQAVQDLHADMLRRHNDACDRWLEIKRLEAERDALREMLARADAALSVWNAAPGCEDVAEADCDAWTEEACERHRLSQKGSGSTKEGE